LDGLSQQELGLSELVCHKTRQRQLLSQSCLLPDVTVGLAKDAGVAEAEQLEQTIMLEKAQEYMREP
jgi:hypothetical protein